MRSPAHVTVMVPSGGVDRQEGNISVGITVGTESLADHENSHRSFPLGDDSAVARDR